MGPLYHLLNGSLCISPHIPLSPLQFKKDKFFYFPELLDQQIFCSTVMKAWEQSGVTALSVLLLHLRLSLQAPTTTTPTTGGWEDVVLQWVRGQPGNRKGTTGASQKHTPCASFFSPSMRFVCVWRDGTRGRWRWLTGV